MPTISVALLFYPGLELALPEYGLRRVQNDPKIAAFFHKKQYLCLSNASNVVLYRDQAFKICKPEKTRS